MKLNVDILLDHLKETMDVQVYGKPRKRLSLGRPVLYTGAEDVFENDRVYVAPAGNLTEDPLFLGKPVIVAVGETLPKEYENGPCVVIWIPEGELFSVFNCLQRVFDSLDEWDSKLLSILNSTASIKDMVDISFPVFRNPIKVIDENFSFLAYSSIIDQDNALESYRPDAIGDIGVSYLKKSLQTNMNLDVSQPFITDGNNGYECLCVNMQMNKVYAGSLNIMFILAPRRSSDAVLAKHLGTIIEQALHRCDAMASTPRKQAYQYFRQLLDGMIPPADLQSNVSHHNRNARFMCGKGTVTERIQKKVPTEYMCRQLEGAFPGSYAFGYDTAIFMLFVLPYAVPGHNTVEKLTQLLEKLEMKMGLSDPFADSTQTQAYYREASIALELGYQMHPNEFCFEFQDYALTYMLRSCCGEFNHNMLFFPGMQTLLEHDAGVAVKAKYTQTLQCYLENSMNVMKTAYILKIHRSTLQERLRSIEKILQVDLNDPNQRLRLLVSLKLLEYEEQEVETAKSRIIQAKKQEIPIVMLPEFDQYFDFEG